MHRCKAILFFYINVQYTHYLIPSSCRAFIMSKKLPIFVLASLLIAVLLLAGRPASIDPVSERSSLPGDLDVFLEESESVFGDLVPGTSKVIYWADSSKQKTPLSVVYLHGFSASRQETAPVSDSLAKRWGANLFYARLTGHGRSSDAMGEATADDWLADAAEALTIGKRLGERVVVIGTSTGATLATWLGMQQDADAIEALILISPNYWPRAEMVGLLLWPYGEMIGKAVEGDYVEWEPANEDHGKYWTNKYPVGAVVEMMRLLRYVNDMDLSVMNVPVQVIYSPDDQVVDPQYITMTFDEIGSSQKEILPLEEIEAENNHVLAGDILSPSDTKRVIDHIDEFVRSR